MKKTVKFHEHTPSSTDEARGKRLVQTVADAALDCGDVEQYHCIMRDDVTGPISGVDDHLGSAFRVLRGEFSPGDIAKITVHHRTESRATGEDNWSVVHARIIRRMDQNTVRAMVRKSKYAGRPLASGTWYEVLCD